MKKIFLALIVVLASIIIWVPFLGKWQVPGWDLNFQRGSQTLWENFDGPNYLIVEKTWYNKTEILDKFSSTLPAEYYPAHFPLYPAIIWVFNLVLRGPWAMLIATLVGTVLCFLMLYKYLVDFKLSSDPWWLTLVFLIFPARWVVVRSIGSPEPWFFFFILASLYFFKKEKYLYAGILGALAQLTKSPGVILLGAYGLYWLVQSIKTKKIFLKMWLVLIMAAVVPVLFWFYGVRTGDFWAYFHTGDNIHLFWPPFSVFTRQDWVGSFWLEDIVWTWLIFGVGILKLKEKKLTIEYFFSGLFFISTLFVAHRDISRYIMPIAPLVLIGWGDVLQKKEFKIIAALLVIPVLLFSWNFLLQNNAPISDWGPYL